MHGAKLPTKKFTKSVNLIFFGFKWRHITQIRNEKKQKQFHKSYKNNI